MPPAKKDERTASVLWSDHLARPMTDRMRNYGTVVPFPLAAWDRGPFFDRLFGHPVLCDIATRLYIAESTVRTTIASPALLAELAAMRHPEGLVPPERSILSARLVVPPANGLPAVAIRIDYGGFYPQARELPCVMDPLHGGWGCELTFQGFRDCRIADLSRASESDIATLEGIRRWCIENTMHRAQAEAALVFLQWAAQCAGASRALFDTLPGLASLLQAQGFGPLVANACRKYSRLPDKFDMVRFRHQFPDWALLWPQHRATLVAMAAVAAHVPNVPGNTRFVVLDG